MSRPKDALIADAVVVDASCRAGELAVRVAPRARVAFDGDGEVETHRAGIPSTGTEDGKKYQDVSIRVTIRGRLHEKH